MGYPRAVHYAICLALALTGCASSIMKGFVGQPLQSVMIKYGAPANAFDMPDGTRAFQWIMSSTYVTPTYATNSGYATPMGNSVYWQQNTQIHGGQPITNTCAYTMFGRWNGTAWVMTGYSKPNLMCQ